MMISCLATPSVTLVLVLSGLLFPVFTYYARYFILRTSRSDAPVKKGAGKGHDSEIDTFKQTFPPSRRDAVVNSTDPRASEYRALLSTGLEPLEKPGRRTPTGFSAADIHKLGSFPDYAVLSGVPHPKPCLAFDIHKAVFRPFRPFRWTYHQTMCEWLPLVLSLSLEL